MKTRITHPALFLALIMSLNASDSSDTADTPSGLSSFRVVAMMDHLPPTHHILAPLPLPRWSIRLVTTIACDPDPTDSLFYLRNHRLLSPSDSILAPPLTPKTPLLEGEMSSPYDLPQ